MTITPRTALKAAIAFVLSKASPEDNLFIVTSIIVNIMTLYYVLFEFAELQFSTSCPKQINHHHGRCGSHHVGRILESTTTKAECTLEYVLPGCGVL